MISILPSSSLIASTHTTQEMSFLERFDTLSTNRQNVLVNMAFNLGIYGLLRFKKMLLAVEKQDWDEAANQMLDSRWSKQVGNRSKELADIMRQG